MSEHRTHTNSLLNLIKRLKNDKKQEVEELSKNFDVVVNLENFYQLNFDIIQQIFINYINRINNIDSESSSFSNETERKQKIISTITTFFEHLSNFEQYTDQTILLLKYIELEPDFTIENIIQILSSIQIIPLFKQLKELNQLLSRDYSKEILEKDQLISELQKQIETIQNEIQSSQIIWEYKEPITIKIPPKFLTKRSNRKILNDQHYLGISFVGDQMCFTYDNKIGLKDIVNILGDSITPCYIFIDNEINAIICGNNAKGQISRCPENVVHGLWKIIGKKMDDPDVIQFCKEIQFKVVPDSNNYPIIEIPGQNERETKQYTIQQLISYLFTKSGGILESYRNITGINSFSDINTVITVPDYYNEQQRNIIYESAKLANFHSIQIISESIASVFGIYWDRKKLCDGYYLYIYFYEEFRISIVEKKGDSYQVLGFHHDPSINHELIVQILSNYVLEEFLKQHPDIKKNDISTNEKFALHRKCSECICKLSQANSTEITLTNFHNKYSLNVYQSKLEFLIDELKDLIYFEIFQLLISLEIERTDIELVLLYNSQPTYINWLTDFLIGMFDKKKKINIYSHPLVCLGASSIGICKSASEN